MANRNRQVSVSRVVREVLTPEQLVQAFGLPDDYQLTHIGVGAQSLHLGPQTSIELVFTADSTEVLGE